MTERDLSKAALRGEPSYVWREGQERRLKMILDAIRGYPSTRLLENGCGVGLYLQHLAPHIGFSIGLEYEFERAQRAHVASPNLVNADSQKLPLISNSIDIILSHEVLEHVADDRCAVEEMVRVLEPGGVIVLFVPNRGYPFETHGIYWRGKYHFGNIPLVHYLPTSWIKRLAPHVRAYTAPNLQLLFSGLPVKIVERKIIFGAYDNLIARFPLPGRFLRTVFQWLEKTPLKIFGLSHFWVIEKL